MKNWLLLVLLLLFACGGRDFRHPHLRKTPRWKKHRRARLGAPLPPLLILPPSRREALDGPVDLELRAGGLLAAAKPLREPPLLDFSALRIGGEQRTLELGTLTGRPGLFFSFDRKRRVGGDAAFAFQTFPRDGLLDCGKVLFHLPQTRRSRPEASPAVTARFGTELEIVPLLDPLVLGPGAELPVRLRFRGPGLAGANLRAELRGMGQGKSSGTVFRGRSDESGMVLVPIRAAGLWILRAETQGTGAAGKPLHYRSFLSFRVPGSAGKVPVEKAR